MRKTCVQPVDSLGTIQKTEYNLYPQHKDRKHNHVANPGLFPTRYRKLSDRLSTAKMRHSNLLHSYLSTFYTGLITNITKETYLKITL